MSQPEPGPIRLISASAGSGKTHRLVNELEEAITREKDPVRPEGIIATTFTVKAAAELRERVRSRLLEAGHVDKAHRLGAARIGTVNAVCGQLVTDFALELGVSPETQVLDEAAAEEAFGHALSETLGVVREEDDPAGAAIGGAAAALTELGERWHELNWRRDVQTIASRARANALTPDMVRASAPRSVEGLLRCFGPADSSGKPLELALERALAAFRPAPHDDTKTTAELITLARKAHTALKAGQRLSWWDWAKLAASQPAKGSVALYEPVRQAARGHERHPGLRDDVRRCIELVFDLAAQALESYQRHKREWGLMDFVDQEVLALKLLRTPAVQEMLREQVDLVLVDEFQDTSPLQLDIFLALSRLAPSSVWVGDQKQAIFGFRGTDPALMDAALSALVRRGGERVEDILRYSWRSRPELVRLTSAVFAPAFAGHGIAAERVRLEPAPEIDEDPHTLGPVVEGWRLGGSKKDEVAAALAAAVGQLVGDREARVRDVLTNKVRPVLAGDIAILCRSHANCERVTRALEAAGISAVRPRQGLTSTPEARIILAALQLWVDPRQPLAAAELGRLLASPADGDAWLGAVLDSPGGAYAMQPELERIALARQRLPLAGPLEAFDAVIEAVGAREACLRWGRSVQGLANLDALRTLVRRYVGTSRTDGEAATVAGLVAQLRSLGAEKKGQRDRRDEQATPNRKDAVTVGTLHSAKGLEWPVTVLYEIDSAVEPTAFGIHLETDRVRFDFSDPLGGRWIRYWPDPYAPQRKTALHESVRQGPEHATVTARESRETLRLLYVGWTRARDRLVLAAKPGKLIGDTLGLLRDRDGSTLIVEPEAECIWAGRPVVAKIRSADPEAGGSRAPEPGSGYDAPGPREFPPASADISAVPGAGTLGKVDVVGPAPFVQGPADSAALGSAVHGFLAADRAGMDAGERLALAASLLKRWSVQGALRAEDLLAASDALRAWVEQHWPAATWHREWPVRMRQDGGTELSGYADLVLIDGENVVVVDHKFLGGTREEALDASVGYAGQIRTYAEAIAKATEKRLAGCFVHLAAQGVIAAIATRSR